MVTTIDRKHLRKVWLSLIFFGLCLTQVCFGQKSADLTPDQQMIISALENENCAYAKATKKLEQITVATVSDQLWSNVMTTLKGKLTEGCPYLLIGSKQSSMQELKNLHPATIASIDVINARVAENLFGDRAQYGAVRINLK